jgi:hypothetical protein
MRDSVGWLQFSRSIRSAALRASSAKVAMSVLGAANLDSLGMVLVNRLIDK